MLGISGDVKIYLNNEFVTKFDGNSLPHNIPLYPNRLIEGVNELRFEFESTSAITERQSRSYVGSPQIVKGITGEPLIVGTSKIFINSIQHKVSHTGNSIEVNLDVLAGIISNQILGENVATGTVENKKVRIFAEYGLINKNTRAQAVLNETKDF